MPKPAATMRLRPDGHLGTWPPGCPLIREHGIRPAALPGLSRARAVALRDARPSVEGGPARPPVALAGDARHAGPAAFPPRTRPGRQGPGQREAALREAAGPRRR